LSTGTNTITAVLKFNHQALKVEGCEYENKDE